jgi:hypothetical protein
LEHEPEYFALVKDLSDEQLVNFTSKKRSTYSGEMNVANHETGDRFEQVRVGTSAYGIHLFGKVSLTGGGSEYDTVAPLER